MVLVEGELSASREAVEAVPQGSALAPVLYSPYTYDAGQLELILLCSRTIPVSTRQGSMNVVFSASWNPVSLLGSRGVNART
jgi:hypothetical protein